MGEQQQQGEYGDHVHQIQVHGLDVVQHQQMTHFYYHSLRKSTQNGNK